MEEKTPLPPNGGRDETSKQTSTISAEHDEEKVDALDTVPHSSPDVRDQKADSDVKTVATAPEVPEASAKGKGKTALIMVAICVRKV